MRLRARYIQKPRTSDDQYRSINKNPRSYLIRLLTPQRRKDGLTIEYLERLLKAQNGRCALSGRQMTCKLIKGTRIGSNVSIDRIIPRGPYTPENIRLVCADLNCFRGVMSDETLIGYCRDIVKLHGG